MTEGTYHPTASGVGHHPGTEPDCTEPGCVASRNRAELDRLVAEQRADDRDAILPEVADGQRVEGHGVDFTPWETEADGLAGYNGYVEARNVRASVPWAPSLVRKGERPHVEHHIGWATVDDLRAELEAIPTKLKGRKGKSRQLMVRRRDRLARAIAAWDWATSHEREPMPELPPVLPENTYRPPAPKQSEYYG